MAFVELCLPRMAAASSFLAVYVVEEFCSILPLTRLIASRYAMTFIPSLLMTAVALAFLRSNEILFAKSMAESEQASASQPSCLGSSKAFAN